MRIIPVMDILDGRVVHAERGERSKYQSLKSVLVNSAIPMEVACSFENLGFKELYIADLDAIMNKGDNLGIIEEIEKKTDLKLLVDAGVKDLEKVAQLFDCGVANVIVGTETLTGLGFLESLLSVYSKDRIIVSLDLMNRKVLSKTDSLKSMNPSEALSKIVSLGFDQIILLDLARVGSGEGVDIDLLNASKRDLGIKVFVGGGVRNEDDLKILKNLGVEGVLIATALHSGKICMQEIKEIEKS